MSNITETTEGISGGIALADPHELENGGIESRNTVSASYGEVPHPEILTFATRDLRSETPQRWRHLIELAGTDGDVRLRVGDNESDIDVKSQMALGNDPQFETHVRMSAASEGIMPKELSENVVAPASIGKHGDEIIERFRKGMAKIHENGGIGFEFRIAGPASEHADVIATLMECMAAYSETRREQIGLPPRDEPTESVKR